MNTHWRLPRGVDELLPPRAWALEQLRRKVLDVFTAWGFEYIEPPVIEYLESLLVGSGEDLDLQTLKVVDQVSGRQLGIRADMTSQAARIDAHSRIRNGVQRLCYAGPVVFANPQIAQTSRVPIKAGVEIFGATELTADAQVINLMHAAVAECEIDQPVLLLGHMGIYRGLVQALLSSGELQAADERELFKCVQRKSEADIRALLRPSKLSDLMAVLPTMMGAADILPELRKTLSAGLQDEQNPMLAAMDQLQTLVSLVKQDECYENIRVDVSELSGYGYHNGPVFAIYHPQHGSALAQGGRYDGIGQAYGRGRAATGFDMKLNNLIPAATEQARVFAPFVADVRKRSTMMEFVGQLRRDGNAVVCAVSANEQADEGMRILSFSEGRWQ